MAATVVAFALGLPLWARHIVLPLKPGLHRLVSHGVGVFVMQQVHGMHELQLHRGIIARMRMSQGGGVAAGMLRHERH